MSFLRNASGARNGESDGVNGWSEQLREMSVLFRSIQIIATYRNLLVRTVDLAHVGTTNNKVGSQEIPCCNANTIGTNEPKKGRSCLMNCLKGRPLSDLREKTVGELTTTPLTICRINRQITDASLNRASPQYCDKLVP